MSLKDYICHHDAPMQPRRETRRCCIGALYAYASGTSQPHRVSMMLECSTAELVASAVFMHHDDLGHDSLMHYAILKGLMHYAPLSLRYNNTALAGTAKHAKKQRYVDEVTTVGSFHIFLHKLDPAALSDAIQLYKIQ